jgi:hypothetical protein
VSDRQASELVKYHLAWKPALNLKLGPSGFHPATFVYFRHWLSKAAKNEVALRAVVAALQEKGFTPKRSKERFDLRHVLVAVARLSALERACETLALALDRNLTRTERPEFWGLLWERYVESKLDYKSGEEGLESKIRQARADYLCLLEWVFLPVDPRDNCERPMKVEDFGSRRLSPLQKTFESANFRYPPCTDALRSNQCTGRRVALTRCCRSARNC